MTAKKSKSNTKTVRFNKNIAIPVLGIVLVVVGFSAIVTLMIAKRNQSYQACFVVKAGDVTCANHDFTQLNTTDIPEINGKKVSRISAAPNFSYYIAATDRVYRDEPHYLLDKDFNIVREIKVPVNTYDMLQTQWTKNGDFAFFHDDIGFLHRYNTATGEMSTLNQSRDGWKKGETFAENKRGDIAKLAMTPDEKLVFTVDDAMSNSGQMKYSLYIMDNDGGNPRQLADKDYIAEIAVRKNGDVLYSVDKSKDMSPDHLGACMSEECQLYSVNPETGESREITNSAIQFWGFAYDAKTDTAFMVRGPGGSVREVFSGNVDRLQTIEEAHHITLSEYAGAWGDYSLIPMGKAKLAVADGYQDSEGVRLYDLKNGQRIGLYTKQELPVSSDTGGGLGIVKGAWPLLKN